MPFNIPEEYYSVILDYAKIAIPSLITFLATRYGLMRPKKHAIREKQFELFYLPLYLLVKQYLCSSEDKQKNLHLFIQKTGKLIYKNYQFVYPKTLRLFDILKVESSKTKPNIYHISNFEYQVISDYEKLKRELGYPTNTFLDSFKRLNKLDKLIYFLYFTIFALSVFTISSFLLYCFQKKMAEAVISLFSYGVCMFLWYIVKSFYKH